MPVEAIDILLWGLMATAAMTVIQQGSQAVGLSRLSLPFLLGLFFTGRRDLAMIFGVATYLFGGVFFAVLYLWLFREIGSTEAWIGALIGAAHGIFLLVVVLPVLPFLNPRVASEHDGPSDRPRIEPPGFLGLHYGYRTPLTTLAGHVAYGAILGAGLSLIGAS
jgi:hypothetical protein